MFPQSAPELPLRRERCSPVSLNMRATAKEQNSLNSLFQSTDRVKHLQVEGSAGVVCDQLLLFHEMHLCRRGNQYSQGLGHVPQAQTARAKAKRVARTGWAQSPCGKEQRGLSLPLAGAWWLWKELTVWDLSELYWFAFRSCAYHQKLITCHWSGSVSVPVER